MKHFCNYFFNKFPQDTFYILHGFRISVSIKWSTEQPETVLNKENDCGKRQIKKSFTCFIARNCKFFFPPRRGCYTRDANNISIWKKKFTKNVNFPALRTNVQVFSKLLPTKKIPIHNYETLNIVTVLQTLCYISDFSHLMYVNSWRMQIF